MSCWTDWVGNVERIVAEASRGVRVDDNEANTAWFLQVAPSQILCIWDWADEATEQVEVDLVPGTSPTVLKVSWTGKKLTPSSLRGSIGLGDAHDPEGKRLQVNGVMDAQGGGWEREASPVVPGNGSSLLERIRILIDNGPSVFEKTRRVFDKGRPLVDKCPRLSNKGGLLFHKSPRLFNPCRRHIEKCGRHIVLCGFLMETVRRHIVRAGFE